MTDKTEIKALGVKQDMPADKFARVMKSADNSLTTLDLFVLYWRKLLPASVLHQESKGTFFSVGWKKKYINEQLRKNGINPAESWSELKC